jgi:1-acyl-sn-glycerol-3-phosphate acyltransferase
MRILRQLAFDAVLFGSCTFFTLCAAPASLASPRYIVVMARAWARTSLWALRVFCGIPLRVSGIENLPEGGAVIAAQHQSTLDVLIWLSILERPSFVFKRELRRVPVFGALLEPSGMVPVDRGGGAAALRDMVTGCKKAAAAGRQIIIFPEGTRVAYGERGTIKQGIAALALGAGVPVVPAATDSGRRWGRESFLKTPGPVHVKIFAPLPAGLSREDVLKRLTEVFYDSGKLED